MTGARLNMELTWESPREQWEKNARSRGCVEERWSGSGLLAPEQMACRKPIDENNKGKREGKS